MAKTIKETKPMYDTTMVVRKVVESTNPLPKKPASTGKVTLRMRSIIKKAKPKVKK
jgi:hypothetical protein